MIEEVCHAEPAAGVSATRCIEPAYDTAHERPIVGHQKARLVQRIQVAHKPFVRFLEGVWDSTPFSRPLCHLPAHQILDLSAVDLNASYNLG